MFNSKAFQSFVIKRMGRSRQANVIVNQYIKIDIVYLTVLVTIKKPSKA